MVISAIKTKWMLFGPLLRVLPVIYASKARSVSYATFSVGSFVGTLPPREGLLLYKAHVDPHLTLGCKVVLDVDRSLGETLGKPQTHCLRRLLGLNPRSMLAVLFTETGIMPIRYRRALLALRNAKGFAAIPVEEEDLARAAFRESLRLAGLGFSYWASDLCWILASLPVPVAMDSPTLLSVEGVDGIIQDLKKACDEAVESETASLVKTQFLKNCLEVYDKGNLTTITLNFRHYHLRVA
ncbi:hypothetical protein FB451DRAFT_1180972 [Mycena latifolia]|nr:hypothetical protein FB451DRAFT_1180972 [Mycena latifolia]